MQNSRLKRLVAGLMLTLLVVGNFGQIEPVQAAVAVLTVTQSSLALSSVTTGDQEVEFARFQLRASSAETIAITRLAFTVSTSPEILSNQLTNYHLFSNGVDLSANATVTAVDNWHQLITFNRLSIRVPASQTQSVSLVADVGPTTTPPPVSVQVGLVKTTNNSLAIAALGVTTGNTLTSSNIIFSPSNSLYGSNVAILRVLPAPSMVMSLAASNPVTSVVAVGGSGIGVEVPVLAVNVQAGNESVEITRIQFNHIPGFGDQSATDFADNGVKLYRRTNGGSDILVGSTTFIPSTVNAGYAAVFTNFAAPLIMGQNDTNTLIVKVIFNGTLNGVPAASSPRVQLGDGVTPDATLVTARGVTSHMVLRSSDVNGVNTLNIVGNEKVLYRSFPIFSALSLGTNSLINGVENDVYKFSVSAASTGDVSLKQLKFDVDVVDVGPHANSLTLSMFRLFRDNTDITQYVTIVSSTRGISVKAGGASITSGAGQAIYVTWPGTSEELIPAGNSYTYTIKATANGFTSDADNDYIRLRLANNQAATGELSHFIRPYFLTTPSNAVQLTNLVTLGDSTCLNTTSADMIWSDRSQLGHSAATSSYTTLATPANSTGDWFNGYYLPFTPFTYTTLTY